MKLYELSVLISKLLYHCYKRKYVTYVIHVKAAIIGTVFNDAVFIFTS